MNSEQAKVKIQRLLALGESPNPNEAAAAIKKAQQLMLQYQLSESDVTEIEPDLYSQLISDIVVNEFPGSAEDVWKRHLIEVVASIMGTLVIYRRPSSRKSTHTFKIMGNRSAVCNTIWMYQYLEDAAKAAAKKRWKRDSVHYRRRDYQKHRKSFLIGFVVGVYEALTNRYTDGEGEGLVHLSDMKRAREYLHDQANLPSFSGKTVRVNGDAHTAGMEAGRATGVDPQTTGQTGRPKAIPQS